GKTVEVTLHHFLRPEQKFEGLPALQAQITKDSQAAKAWFS
ncbi:MAG: riboflavin kinase, partial [Pseudomonadota bacterium]